MFLTVLTGLAASLAPAQETIDLSGKWGFQTDITDSERAFENFGAHRDPVSDTIVLPGTTDTNKKGVKTTGRPVDRLSRIFEYVGPAWYQKEVDIPPSWDGRSIQLFIERTLWISSVYVDGGLAGEFRSFSAPHTHDLTNVLSPGKHLISICIDNRVPMIFERWCHAYTEFTQGAWNGMVGKMELRSRPAIGIKDVQVYPRVKSRIAEVVCIIDNPEGQALTGTLTVGASATNTSVDHAAQPVSTPVSGTGTEVRVKVVLPMGDKVQLWDEFHPSLYHLSASLSVKADGVSTKDQKSVTFGMREYGQSGAHFTLNGRPVFLRGTLECAVFPLTGYPDMSVDGWLRIFRIIKSYGLNHMRFHSWCPPEAAFAAADQAGVYLQAELPCWTEVGKNPELNAFFTSEMDRILSAYGNHPSFVQLCMGNELKGDFDFLAGLVRHGMEVDPRHLYSGSTARKHIEEDQFYVSHVSSAGGITTYGARGPMTDYDLRDAYSVLKVPGVAHEVGQRAVYPNFKEMAKYTGVMVPRNFEVFREKLASRGMLDQADKFVKVSGQMTAFLYKESIEALLRTPNCGGFQLLDLHDFPGQGTALVGILDPFWDTKGIVTPEKFRESCGATVPILRLPKRTYCNDETLNAKAELYHYGEKELGNAKAAWDVKTASGKVVASGTFKAGRIGNGGLFPLGDIAAPLSGVAKPQKLIVTLRVDEAICNSWEIWVYPKQQQEPVNGNLVVAKTLEEATRALRDGKSVVLTPEINEIDGKRAEFQNHFWCPTMFRWEPMTMGTLVQDKHAAFRAFPTEFYTNWQWWEIVSNAKLLVLDDMPKELKPIVQPIDTYDRCLKLGLLIEAKVSKGRLLFSSMDLQRNLEKRPAARQLLYSLMQYASGAEFDPKVSISEKQLGSWFRKPSLLTGAKVVMTDSFETGNEPGNVLDGDPNTFWHTAYYSPGTFAVTNMQTEADYPHEIQIELAKQSTFKGFACQPRSDGVNGYIARYEFYVSEDGETWGAPVSAGSFARNGKEKTVLFDKPVTARHVRLVALKGFAGQKWASLAELKLLPVE